MVDKTDSLENLIKAEGVLATSDLHGDSNLISSSLKTANDGNYAVLMNGDVVNDYGFTILAHEMNIYSGQELQLNYFESNLSKQDLQAYRVAMNASQYGLDAMLQSIPEEHKVEAKKGLEEALKYAESELFQKKIEKVSQNFIAEKGEEIQENQLKLRALYDVFMDEEAKSFANELNKYQDTKVLFNKGNHENAFFIDQVKQYLDNKEQIIDLNKIEGYAKVKDSKGNLTTIAGMTNSVQMMSYISEIFSQEEMDDLYYHMKIDKIKEESMLIGEIKKEDVEAKKSFVELDEDFKRIKKGNLEEKLDIFVTHGQVGRPATNSNKVYDVPYSATAAALSLEADLTVEGHIHSKYEGVNSFGKNMIRAAGNEAAIIYKDKNGVLQTKWETIGTNYNPIKNEIPYNIAYLHRRVEDRVKEYQMLMKQNSTGYYEGSDSKAA